MAEIYRGVGGKPIQEWLAETDFVHAVIEEHTAVIGARAELLKAAHVDEGDAFVEVEIGNVDGWVILNDTRGKKAAMAMEFGSDPHPGWPEGTPAQLILHHASGIPIKHTHPRSRRKKRYYASKKRRKKK